MNKIRMNISHPREWPLLRIQDICIIVSRGTAPVYTDYGKVLAIGQRCVREWGFMINEARFHDQRYMNRALRPEKGDVLLNSTGTGTIGRSCVFHAHGDFLIDGHITLLRPDLKKLDGRWLNCILQSPEGQVHLETQCYSGSTNQVELSRERLMATAISLPPLPEQHRIAEILDTIDEAIKKTEALIEKLKAMKQGLLHDLLTRGLDENGKLRDPKAHPEQFKNSPLGPIPREWCFKPLHEAAVKIQDGTHFSPKSSNGPCRYLTSKNVRFGHLELSDCGFISKKEHEAIYLRCDVKCGDILLTKDGANTGNAAINSLKEEFSLLSSVAFIRVDNITLRNDFLLQYLLSPVGQRRIKDLMSGLAITRLTVEKIRNFQIPIPKPDEQRLIANQLISTDFRIDNEERYRDKLKLQKKGLMHDLLTGKVRV